MHPPKGGIPILDFDFPIANLLHACHAGLSIESWVFVTHSIRQCQSDHIRIIWSSRADRINRMTTPAETSSFFIHAQFFYLYLPYRYRATAVTSSSHLILHESMWIRGRKHSVCMELESTADWKMYRYMYRIISYCTRHFIWHSLTTGCGRSYLLP